MPCACKERTPCVYDMQLPTVFQNDMFINAGHPHIRLQFVHLFPAFCHFNKDLYYHIKYSEIEMAG